MLDAEKHIDIYAEEHEETVPAAFAFIAKKLNVDPDERVKLVSVNV